MKVKKTIILLTLVVFLASLANVYAGEMDDALASEDASQIGVSSTVEDNLQASEENAIVEQTGNYYADKLSRSGEFDELQKLIDNASDNGIINLEHNYTYTVGTDNITEGISISKNLTINGNGFTIDAQGKSRIFNIDSGTNVVLNNIIFINGFTEGNGGAILSYGNVKIAESSFINNTAKSGGALYFAGDYSDSKIDSEFIDNYANNGGAIYFNGAITNVTIIGLYNGNVAQRGGGAIFVRGNSMNNTFTADFIANEAKAASGGAVFIYNQADNNIFEGSFTDNYALYGGAMFFYNKANSNVFNSEFTNNTAKSCGGAMFFHNTTDGNNFTGDFTGNHALGEVDESV